jgi:hypothetical protein
MGGFKFSVRKNLSNSAGERREISCMSLGGRLNLGDRLSDHSESAT